MYVILRVLLSKYALSTTISFYRPLPRYYVTAIENSNMPTSSHSVNIFFPYQQSEYLGILWADLLVVWESDL